jgi:DNA-binding XRE family transcriptional regulator
MSKEELLYYVNRIDPLASLDDVEEFRELNEWDLYILFNNGKKVVFDRFSGYYKDIFYDNIHEITEELETKEFAYRLRSLMGRNNITQDELAEMIGVSRPMISNYVRGMSIPSVMVVRKMAKVFGCSLDDFFYEEI